VRPAKYDPHHPWELPSFLRDVLPKAAYLAARCDVEKGEEILWYYSLVDNREDPDVCVKCAEGGRLLICDGCEGTWHRGCADLLEMPDDTWFCPTCAVGRAEDPDVCAECEEGGRLLICDGCAKCWHLGCVELDEAPEGDWYCAACAEERGIPADEDVCAKCGDGGSLLICDACAKCWHRKCAKVRRLPPGDWHCRSCLTQR
jgi:hypothetical protein